jgi:O-6-methylguanine DNA methyltransferase
VLRSLEASLDRLGLDRVDIALLHDPDHHAEQALTEAYPALERLRAEGVVKAIGIGVNQCALPARFLRETDIDVVLLAGRYTLLEQEGLAEVLPEAAARGRSVIVGGVFNSGLLTDPKPGAMYDYAPTPPHVLDRALRMKAVADRHGVPLRAAALRFPLGHPAVASVLSGARSTKEVRDTVDQMRRTVPAALRRSRTVGRMNSHGQYEQRVVWAVVGTDIGPLLLAATRDGLVNVVFHAMGAVPDKALGQLASRLGSQPVEAPDSPLMAEAIRQIGAYFAGERHDFELPLDWSLTSGFNRRVLRELASGVPYGTVVGYGDLAGRVGHPGAAQAVGSAMGSNPLPVVVPCHRVLESGGGIGGFGGGLETKRKLLALEGVLPEPLF